MGRNMTRDSTGNKKSNFATLGASSHSDHDREVHDFYATDPSCALDISPQSPIWEPACGQNHLTNMLVIKGHTVRFSDLVDRGVGAEILDFLKSNETWDGDIVTNPPFKYATAFVEKSMETVTHGRKVYMFLKLLFLEGQRKRKLFDKYPPKEIHVYSSRKECAINGDFSALKSSSPVCYAWFVWEKGWHGDPIIKWI